MRWLARYRPAASVSPAEMASDHTALVAALQDDVNVRDTVLAAMSEGVLLFNSAGHLAYVNDAARSTLGRLFTAVDEVFPQALREAVIAARQPPASPGPHDRTTYQFEAGGAVIEATVQPAGSPGTVVVMLRDVTEARRVERLRTDFVANASHELKTPVATIMALATSLRTAASDDHEAVGRLLPRLELEAERLAALVADLLALSRLDGGALERTDVRLDTVVETEGERLRPRAEAVGLRLEVDAPGPLEILGSQPDLALMVHNLLDNAIGCTAEGGQIRASLQSLDGMAQLTVTDTGVGIPPEDLDRIFERFYRVDSARLRRTDGIGLGLSIARNVAETHGGEVQVRSVLGEGSEFVVRLPLPDGVVKPAVAKRSVPTP